MELVSQAGVIVDVAVRDVQEPMITLEHDGVKITLLGTAHVSRTSADKVRNLINHGDYDAVALELCPNRYQSLVDPDAISKLDLGQVIRNGKGAMVMVSLALGAFQQRLADQFGIESGADMRAAIKTAAEKEAPVFLIDRDIGITLKRIYRNMPWRRRLSVMTGLVASVIARRTVSEEEVEQLKQGDVLESTFAQFAETSADIYGPLVDERDRYMVAKLVQELKEKNYRNVLVVVGAGHLAGMRRSIDAARHSERPPQEVCAELDVVPPPSRIVHWLSWSFVALILLGFAIGFAKSSAIGWGMVATWVFVHGTLAAIGALIAAGHPLTIISAFLAAPLTALNPVVSAGMISGAVEAWIRKPLVSDFSRLRADASRIKGWWSNRVARTFLVYFFSGLGSSIGTVVAGYQMFGAVA